MGNKRPEDELPTVDVDDPTSPFHIPAYRVERTAAGWALETDGTADDHGRALDALHVLMGGSAPTAIQRATSPTNEASTKAPRPAPRVLRTAPGIALGEAARKYLLTLEGVMMPDKTRTQKRASVNGFTKWKGLRKSLRDCSRTDVAEWVQSLRSAQLATPTIVNKLSSLTAFFAWAMGAGYYAIGDNPSSGQLSYGKREKRLRRKLGFEPFTLAQINVIYDKDTFGHLSPAARWGSLIGLYTGARVSEIGQLALSDFFEDEGTACFQITAGGLGQSVKNDASERVVPIHPALIALGLIEHIDALRKAGQTRLFPRAKIGSVNGQGNFLSAAFGRYIAALGITPKVGMFGFHSLRKTVIQTMQTASVSAEFRAQYVGHELGDEHHTTYSRKYSPGELARAIHPALNVFMRDLTSQ